MKKYLWTILATFLIPAILFTACGSTDKNSVKGKNDFYIIVTDRNGEEKALYYMENEASGRPNIYMEHVDSDPEIMFEFRSVVSYSEPAKNGEAFFGERLREFAEQADFKEIVFGYSVSKGASKGRSLLKSENEKRYNKLSDLLFSFEPEYVPGLEKEQITEYGKYDPRYPIRYISFDYDRDNIHSSEYPELYMDFCEYNGDILGRLVICDYSELQKLAKGPQPVSKRALKNAYYKSEYCVSDWFYAKDTELYDYALKCIILCDDNELYSYNIKQDRTLSSYSSTGGFSDDIAELINTDTDNLDGWQDAKLGDLYFKLPGDKKPIETEKMLMLTTGNDNEILVKISQNGNFIDGSDTYELRNAYLNGKASGTYDDYTLYGYVKGTFNGETCEYISYVNDITENYYCALRAKSVDGTSYVISCSIKSDEPTEEFYLITKNIFGSISLFAPDEKVSESNIKLSQTPSIYSDDCYELAEGMSFYGQDEYRAFCPGTVTASFYAIDFNHDYDIGFECYLEKQEADGLWYTVEPIGEVIQANGSNSGHFYNVFETARKNVTFDLAAYPLLPAGKYRLAMPFWDEGGSDRDQYAAFYDFIMDEKINTGDEIVGTAYCEKDEYPTYVSEIKYTVEIEGGSYSVSNITDIERLENDRWVSVRSCPVKTNSIGGSYALRFSGGEEVIDTSGFDISQKGEYRIRISVGEVDIDDPDMFVSNYDTKYAYFKIG